MSGAIGFSRESNPSRRICDLRAVSPGHVVDKMPSLQQNDIGSESILITECKNWRVGKGKGTGQRVLSTHCVGHSQLAAHYKYQ